MLNLLFISNNLKTDIIKQFLQPLLKVKIDVVTDFDNGLKDVFEKRPATIFIQEQIAGVRGESVARHIQMLLGDGAPSFILMHEGNARVKPVKGLFECLIDLTQPDNKLIEDVLTILKFILGPEWVKNVMPEEQGPDVQAVSFAVPEEKRVDADRLVDDLLSDLEAADGEASDVLQTPEMTVSSAATAVLPLQDHAAPVSTSTVTPPAPGSEKTDSIPPAAETEQIPSLPSPADFRISAGSQETHEQIPEELLLAFEDNYHSHANFRKKLAVAVVVVAGLVTAGWLLLRQNPNKMSLMNAPAIPPSASTSELKKQADVHAAAPAAQKQISASRKPKGTITSPLPAFITAGSLDSSFSARKPGWERYAGKAYECRVFRTGGDIKAVQVMAVKGKSISDNFMESALKEVTGNSGFSIVSNEQKNGLLIQRGSAGKKADLLIYRTKTSGAIRAFVVSLN